MVARLPGSDRQWQDDCDQELYVVSHVPVSQLYLIRTNSPVFTDPVSIRVRSTVFDRIQAIIDRLTQR